LAFDGPAYRGLRANDFKEADRSVAQGCIRILCGLYGVLRPFDLIRPYRLEMGTKIKTLRGNSLYDFWGDDISVSLAQDLKAAKPKILVNCASQEYWKSIRTAKLPTGVRVVTCDFPGPSVFAKKARGMMCRHIVTNRVTTVDGLKNFNGDGEDRFAFSPGKSSADKLVFLRTGGAAIGVPRASTKAKAKAKSVKEEGPKKRPAAAPVSAPSKRAKR
ncbi:unnamed protein product, partial [Polarella glacialis]